MSSVNHKGWLFVGLWSTQVFAQQPNIIIILADDLGYSDLGCMGGEINTPHLDQLAKDGILLTHFYTSSRSCPSRASLLTGLYQTRAGIGHMNEPSLNIPAYQGFLSNQSVTIAEILQQNGYRTLMAGKWHVGDAPEHWPNKRGFDSFYGIPSGGGIYFYPSKYLERPIYLNDEMVIPLNIDSSNPDSLWYSTDAFTDYAIRFVRETVAEKENRPFFLYLPYIAPHFPLQAHESDIDKYRNQYNQGYEAIRKERFRKQQRLGIVTPETVLSPNDFPSWDSVVDKENESKKMAVYAAQVECMDRNIGRLIDHLNQLKILDNTIIIFLSDNGASSEMVNRSGNEPVGTAASFMSYGKSWGNVSSTPYRLYKSYNHQGGLLSPCIISWKKGIAQPGQILHQPAHIIDIMPTVLSIANVAYPQRLHDTDLYPLDGKDVSSIIKTNMYDGDRELYFQHMGNAAVINGDWKAVMCYKGDWELYNLKNDPTELHNVCAQNAVLCDSLVKKYNHWSKEYGVLPWPLSIPQ